MTGSALAMRRHRITLMQQKESIGAGGRMVKTTPILADVWAAVSEGAGGASERADKQIFPSTARFTVRYNTAYQQARFISWRGARYKVQGMERALNTNNATLTFDTQLTEGEVP